MIKNDRQYRITKAQVQKFENALNQVQEKSDKTKKFHSLLQRAEGNALRSQLDNLRKEIREYEKLRSGEVSICELESLEELPQTLIKARIASGLTQKELAERLGLKEQQIQRYEATDYSTANLRRLLEIFRALGIRQRKGASLLDSEISLDKFLKRLTKTGLDYDFVVKRLIPPHLSANVESRGPEENERTASLVMQLAGIVGRVFGWTPDAIFRRSPLKLNMCTVGSANFKVTSRAERRRLNAYIVYAHYLALLVLESTSALSQSPFPTDPHQVREVVLSNFGSITLENVLRYVWSLGIPVLPLNDPGAFHGACWRVERRNIIVLKQRTRSQARWLFDLLHELWHVAQKPDQDQLSVIEASPLSKGQKEPADEEVASQFAGDVILSGRAEELAQLCVRAAKGRVEWLKRAVPQVAEQENVPVDSLANYMAFRLSLQGINWWGTAENLQVTDSEPWLIARSFLLEQGDFEKINKVDRNMLMQALLEEED